MDVKKLLKRMREERLENKKNNGIAVTGVALTNRPHIRLKEHPVTLAKEGDLDFVRVPFMVEGLYEHPWNGYMLFGEEEAKEMLSNLKKGVADADVGLDLKHDPELGMLAWLEESRGGRITREKEGDDWIWVGYGPVVNQKSLEVIPQYSAASVEIYEDYKSNRVHKLSEDDRDGPIKLSQLKVVDENTLEEVMTIKLTQEKFDALNAEKVTLEGKITSLEGDVESASGEKESLKENVATLEARVVELEALVPDEDPELPAAWQAKWDRLEQSATKERVKRLEAVFSSKKTEDESPAAFMLNSLKGIVLDGKVDKFKLESGASGEEIQQHYQDMLVWVLENDPGLISTVTSSTPDDERPGSSGAPTDAELDARADEIIGGK